MCTPCKCRRNVAADYAIGKAFNNGGLANARFAGKDGIVLAAAHEDVDHLADFLIAAEDRVDLARLGIRGQVHGVLVEMRGLAFEPGGAGVACAGALALSPSPPAAESCLCSSVDSPTMS